MQKMKMNRFFIIMLFFIIAGAGCAPALHRAARDNDVAKIELLIHKGKYIDELTGRYGYSPLHYAAACGSMKALEYLLDNGADINAKGWAEITPLHAACGLQTPLRPGNGSSEAAKYLIKRGADAYSVDGFSNTPMDYATMNGRLDVVQELLDKGVDINFGNKTIGTVLFSAFTGSQSEEDGIVKAKFLLQRGADVNATRSDGTTPLLLVARGGNCGWARVLVEHGADVNQPDQKGETPLFYMNQYCSGVDWGESSIKK